MQMSGCNWFCFAGGHLNWRTVEPSSWQNNESVWLNSETWCVSKMSAMKNCMCGFHQNQVVQREQRMGIGSFSGISGRGFPQVASRKFADWLIGWPIFKWRAREIHHFYSRSDWSPFLFILWLGNHFFLLPHTHFRNFKPHIIFDPL